jgi:hypothetical protein
MAAGRHLVAKTGPLVHISPRQHVTFGLPKQHYLISTATIAVAALIPQHGCKRLGSKVPT